MVVAKKIIWVEGVEKGRWMRKAPDELTLNALAKQGVDRDQLGLHILFF
jgi:hypothetical protein